MIVPQEIGQRICYLRRNKGMTQEQLADVLNIGANHMYRIESGKRVPSIDLYQEISEYFGVSIDFLLTGKQQGAENPRELLHIALHALTLLDKQGI